MKQLWLLLLLWLPSELDAQVNWRLNAGVITYRINDLNGWGQGIDVLARRAARRIAIEFGVTALLTSTGFYEFGGASAMFGVGPLWEWNRASASLTAGASGLGGGDSDGTYFYAGGLYAAAEGTWWWSSRVGLYSRVVGRLWQNFETGPSASAGVSIRL